MVKEMGVYGQRRAVIMRGRLWEVVETVMVTGEELIVREVSEKRGRRTGEQQPEEGGKNNGGMTKKKRVG